MPPKPQPPEALMKRIAIGGPSHCWPFTGVVTGNGYGRMWAGGRQVSVHRLAYFLATGEEPGDLQVLHTCDNRRCCNPAHLFLGTHQDNMDDMCAKGRNVRGEAVTQAKLTADDVIEIRRLRSLGHTRKAIARRFGVTRSNITLICQRRTWRHV